VFDEVIVTMTSAERFELQESEYCFPYHYLPYLDNRAGVHLHRQMAWGMEYLTYVTFVVDLIRQRKPQSLLDVGCGDGRLIHMVKSLVPHVWGIDLSEQALGFARAFNPNREFLCGGIENLTERYACVTVIEVLEHIPDADVPQFIEHLARIVEPGGCLVISVPTVNVPLSRKHYRHYDLELLRTTLEPYFQIEGSWWLCHCGGWQRWIQSLACNGLYTLNYRPIL